MHWASARKNHIRKEEAATLLPSTGAPLPPPAHSPWVSDLGERREERMKRGRTRMLEVRRASLGRGEGAFNFGPAFPLPLTLRPVAVC